MFLKLDGTFWVQLINFAIFFAILSAVFLRPVSQAIVKRREFINSLTADHDRYQAEAGALRARAEAVRAAARRDAEQLLSKSRADASNEAAGISAQYTQRATQTIETAQNTVKTELDAALKNESQLTRQLADTMLDRALSETAK